ncbi:MAG: ABC transporter permease [Opitutaceae bacterium]|nr:ABC transporter permease [Opitutaceae bacterium]
MTRLFRPSFEWQSRAVLMRHVRVHLRNWHTAALPPVFEPLVMLLAFGVGLGGQINALHWRGEPIDYMTFLAPGILAYTAFMTAFFQSLFSAYMRMHYQKSWEGQLTTQVRLEHVVWGEMLWAATLATAYAVIVCLVLLGFGAFGALDLQWQWLPVAIPLLFHAAVGFAAVGLYFTAILPSMDHMGLPFFLLILPVGFTSNTYFPLPEHPVFDWVVAVNPLYHLAEGVRNLLITGTPTLHLVASFGLCTVMVALLLPLDMRLLRKRVFGDG